MRDSGHPSANGQAGRTKRTRKDSIVHRVRYNSRGPRRTRLAEFLADCSFARRHETFGDLSPCECIGKVWTSEPRRFARDPIHQMSG